MTSIKSNVDNILSKLPKEVTLVAVTKTVEVSRILEVLRFGINNIGENKVQEAEEKFPQLQAYSLNWHLIGRLQTNKAKKAVKMFDLIHSLDRFDLAEALNKEAHKINKIQNVLLQVNTSLEETKAGFFEEELLENIKLIAKLENISIKGLMTIGSNTNDENQVRKCFAKLRELKNKINELKLFPEDINILSMGMTNDYEIAIREGSNMVRVGRAIFGDRSVIKNTEGVILNERKVC